MKFSSDPDSPLNKLRIGLKDAKDALVEANKRRDPRRGKYLGAYNKARHALKYYVTGTPPAKRYPVDFEIKIAGIPAGVCVLSYEKAKPFVQHTFSGAGPGDYEPPEFAEVEFVITDRKGYKADWLRQKSTESEIIQLLEKGEYHGDKPP